MTLPEGPKSVHCLDHEQLASDAHRVAGYFQGAIALLTGDCSPRAIRTARDTMLEAQAYVVGLVQELEGIATREAEQKRAEQAHRAEAAKQAARVGAP